MIDLQQRLRRFEALAACASLAALVIFLPVYLFFCLGEPPVCATLKLPVPCFADYPQFFAAGNLTSVSPEQLYDPSAQAKRVSEVGSEFAVSQPFFFRYPPFVGQFFQLFTGLPYTLSAALYGGASLLILGCALCLLPGLGKRSAFLALGFPVVLEAFGSSQLSLLGSAALVGTIVSIHKGHPFLGGLICSLLLYKPNAYLIFTAGLLAFHLARGRKSSLVSLTLGWTTGAALLFSSTLLSFGADVTHYWMRLSEKAISRGDIFPAPIHKQFGLAPLVPAVSGLFALILLLGVVIAVVAAIRTQHSFLRFAGNLICLNALLNPYLPIYDLLPLMVAAVLCWGETKRLLAINARDLCWGGKPCSLQAEQRQRAVLDDETPLFSLLSLPPLLVVGLLYCGPHFFQLLSAHCNVPLNWIFTVSAALFISGGPIAVPVRNARNF